jgi:hypothetical protein
MNSPAPDLADGTAALSPRQSMVVQVPRQGRSGYASDIDKPPLLGIYSTGHFPCQANLLVVFLHVSRLNERVLDTTTFFAVLGKRVRRIREARHFTQEDMMAFGFSARHWQQIEKGRPTTMTTLLRITVAFDIPLCRLVRGLPRPVVSGE